MIRRGALKGTAGARGDGRKHLKVAITGAAGLFGHGLVQVFSERHQVFPLTRAKADITRREEIGSVIRKLRPDVIVHPAGIPDLDVCEADPARAFLVNVHGTRNILGAARPVGAAVAYISTDAVFDGKKSTPYTESDPTIPPTVYGRTKLKGEELVRSLPESWVFRVSLLFGPGKTNFVERAVCQAAAGEIFVGSSDQLGSATYTLDAGRKILEVVEGRRFGLYHLSNSGICTRWELAAKAVKFAGLDAKKVLGKPSAEMAHRAVRLKYAVMATEALSAAGFAPLRSWQEALAEYVATLHPPRASRSRCPSL
jgi:dTDP-4-dehydrorhamnose reductase